MSKYKLIALDMDGTVLDDHSVISEENVHWINKAREAGVTVMFSTGRGFNKAIDYAEQLKLDSPIITVNGSEIWEKPYQLLDRTLLDHRWINKLYELAQRYSDAWFWAYTTDEIYNKENWQHIFEQYDQHEWLKFGYYVEDIEMITALRLEVEQWGELEISNSSPYNIEINPYNTSKATALKKLCDHMEIQMEQVIAVGDSLNDIKAIQQCGLGVAMGNAQEEVKQVADYITASNNDHGVAEVIRKFIFNM